MIASPSDVPDERVAVREVIYEWNATHSADRSIVLLPMGWETHASPSMAGRPQSVINKQILKAADLLIAVFWTRLGSPSGETASGTVEEIEEHLADGKPAMIYFSDAPVRLDSVDDGQYAALRDFRESCYARGLCASYDSVDDLRRKFARQLAQTVIREFADAASILTPAGDDPRSASPPATLSAPALAILRAAAEADDGQVTRMEHASGVSVGASREKLFDGYGGREHAQWEDALTSLVTAGYLRIEHDDKGITLYMMTARGFEAADRLTKG